MSDPKIRVTARIVPRDIPLLKIECVDHVIHEFRREYLARVRSGEKIYCPCGNLLEFSLEDKRNF